MPGYFISGTDTNIGKTVVTLGLMTALQKTNLKVTGMKPVASGCVSTREGLRNEDALKIRSLSSNEHSYEQFNPYAFEPPVAPHVIAEENGVLIDFHKIQSSYEKLVGGMDVIVVEGVGGWNVPLGPNKKVSDLALSLNLPVILVIGLKLGCINHAILTAEAIRSDGIPLKGWVANEVEPVYPTLDPTIDYLKANIASPMLAHVPYMENLNIDEVAATFNLSLLS